MEVLRCGSKCREPRHSPPRTVTQKPYPSTHYCTTCHRTNNLHTTLADSLYEIFSMSLYSFCLPSFGFPQIREPQCKQHTYYGNCDTTLVQDPKIVNSKLSEHLHAYSTTNNLYTWPNPGVSVSSRNPKCTRSLSP
jgi:hypothetical protein